MPSNRLLRIALFLGLLLLPGLASLHAASSAVLDPQAIQALIFDGERLRLTADYARSHYGVACAELQRPEMIVVHFTAIPTLEGSLDFFRPVRLDQRKRRDIVSGGEVNVSVHYLIDRDGTLYQLAAENVLCRHTIGFNQSAIGIENVAADAGQLSAAQVEATAALISRIVGRHPEIAYLIGHHEYRERTLPHYRLFREDDHTYRFTDKVDPGTEFMGRVRKVLARRYGIRLQA